MKKSIYLHIKQTNQKYIKPMKKLFLLLFIGCTAFACEQNDVAQTQTTMQQTTKSKYRTLDEAIDIAEKATSMLGEQTRATKRPIDRSRVRAILNNSATTRSAAADTLIYIINFEDSAGFALVPRSTSKPELLAVTEKGNYDGSKTDNEGFNIYMKYASDYVARNDSASSIENDYQDEVITEVQYTAEYDTTTVAPKLTVNWGQNDPFNLFCYCRDVAYINAPVGCVAVAIAQVMSYYNQPENIYITYDNSYSNISLNWSSLKKVHYYGYSNYGAGDYITLAMLMREIGHQIGMTYASAYETYPTSTAETSNAVQCLNNWGYHTDQFNPFSHSDVISSLNNDRLVIMRGFNDYLEIGHAWVIDGYMKTGIRGKEWHRQRNHLEWTLFLDTYDQNTYLHFNWGNNGAENGYFLTQEVFINYNDNTQHTSYMNVFDVPKIELDYNTTPMMISNIYYNELN